MEVGVKTKLDEMGVGAIVDPPVVEYENDMVIFLPNVSPKEKPYTTQTAINCMGMFSKIQRIFDTDLTQLSMFTGNQVMSLRAYI